MLKIKDKITSQLSAGHNGLYIFIGGGGGGGGGQTFTIIIIDVHIQNCFLDTCTCIRKNVHVSGK